MRQTLFHIPLEVGGLPTFGLGWLLAIWALGTIGWLGWHLARRGFSAEVRANLPVLLVLGAVIAFLLPRMCDDRGLPIRGYGVMLLLGVVSGVSLAAYRARRAGLDPDMIFSLAFWMCVAGIFGARLFYVMQYWREYHQPGMSFWQTAVAVVNYTQGGLVVFGAAIGAGLALLAFVYKYCLPGWTLADLVAPSVMIGLAFGRLGCFLNGCCFGGVCEQPWAVTFPWKSPPHLHQVEQGLVDEHGLKITGRPEAAAVITEVVPDSPAALAGLKKSRRIVDILINGKRAEIDGKRVPGDTVHEAQLALALANEPGDRVTIYTADRAEPATFELAAAPRGSLAIHPVQLYAAFDALLLCGFLLAYAPYRRREGELFAWMITIHPVFRFLEETLRTDEQNVLGTNMHISQNISLLMLACGIGLWLYLLRSKQHRAGVVLKSAGV
jgi:phosphatidylglycerol---prolipoprotein diacylglyceryl transferase